MNSTQKFLVCFFTICALGTVLTAPLYDAPLWHGYVAGVIGFASGLLSAIITEWGNNGKRGVRRMARDLIE